MPFEIRETEVTITADVQPDGSVLVTDRRVIEDPRQVEFLEFLAPQGGSIESLTVSDQLGAFPAVTETSASTRGYRTENSGQVLYVEWSDPAPRCCTKTSPSGTGRPLPAAAVAA